MKQGGLILGILIGVVIVASVSATLANNYLTKHAVSNQTVQCPSIKARLQVVIQNNRVTPITTYGQLCDSLTITNQDNRLRAIAFGPHDHHVAYDGVLERIIYKDQSVTVTLNQTGSFSFHDHIEDSVIGYFDVSQP